MGKQTAGGAKPGWWGWTRRVLIGVCALGLALPAGLSVVRLGGWDDGTALAMPMVLLPYAALGTLVLLGVLLALRSWWVAVVAGLLAVLQLCWLVPRFIPEGGSVAADAPRLRVATSNAYMGRVDAAELIRLVREQRVDVLALEEFWGPARAALERAGIAELLPYRQLPEGRDTVLYSRLPLTPLDASAPTAARAQVTADVSVGGRTVRLTAVHTYYPLGDAAAWSADFAELRAAASEGGTRNAVLLGDFNATLDHAPMRDLLATGLTDTHAELGRGVAPTWPEDNDDFPYLPPVIQIDHVLHGDALTAVSVAEHRLPGTDHRAVVAELALTG
ncbi:endonuclease/exonuclease/phosphatase family protein [Kitasatospora sp. CM 4170]|uniref:Endonuclease/exonuclease/phosphatase family protein n=1 Tax=Kitasatospora aburaviensis TaxID=67265 RepID=A0ABW1F2F6_9ACTN|nr:endonuclease/exonuclease/phosphatase family protein [Kitasatospora sp. CM 4170]WNM49423.1 endonuclease/exonuclease/phosphatase family protein [Kitasatospora sp. CM 4170]